MSEQPHPDRVRLLPFSVPPWLVDGLLATQLALLAIGRAVTQADVTLGVVEFLSLAAAIGLVVARRYRPILALAATVAAAIGVVVVTERPNVLLLAALIILYTVVTEVPWRTALAAGAATVLAFTAVLFIFLEPGRLEGGLLAAIAWPAFATAAGSAVRLSRENLASARERARRAEATRELEAERRVVEERLRIARDVHDLVAHHLAVVNVQSGVANHLLASDPEAAGAALETVRTSASTAISELGELLGVLRDTEHADGPVDPTPDLGAIDDLISSFSASGLRVEHRISGAPRPLSPTVEVAAYRVVQEALTNAHKHGDGAALLAQGFDDDAMELEVSNRVRATGDREAAPSGYGLLGMRERVEAVGGKLSVVHDNDRFTVTATLPTQATP